MAVDLLLTSSGTSLGSVLMLSQTSMRICPVDCLPGMSILGAGCPSLGMPKGAYSRSSRQADRLWGTRNGCITKPFLKQS